VGAGFIKVPSSRKTKQPKTIEDENRKVTTRNKDKKSDDTELQPMIPEENQDPCHTDQRKPSKVQHLAQEIGDGNDSDASTSEDSPEMADTASEQQDDHSSNNTQD
jgi:hypothetical protein